MISVRQPHAATSSNDPAGVARTLVAALRLTRPQISAALKRHGRIYHLQVWTEKIHAGLRAEHLR
ncbi:hypothetical protein GCM10023259_041730 [Thermocatellispora tengchongensis]